MKDALKKPIVVDLRNIYRPEEMHAKGFKYVSVGRA
jgi:UDPglucose 6-dehydrogenase